MMVLAQSARKELQLAENWRFSLENDAMKGLGVQIAAEGYDDASWEVVSVPHDWAIKGPFDENNDKQVTKVVEDGETMARVRSGRTGALPIVGVGWYRLKFKVADSCERAILTFGGVFGEPEVYVNGHKAGEWKNPYTSLNPIFDLKLYFYIYIPAESDFSSTAFHFGYL